VGQIPLVGTEPGGNNSGIALLELMAWISDMLAHRVDQLGKESYLPTARLAAASLSLVKNRAHPPDSVLKGVRFYEGQLLVDNDLSAEVDYTRGKCSGLASGIVCGLQISVQDGGSGSTVHVTPGYALDTWGRKIVLNNPVALSLPATLKSVSVIARPKGGSPLSIVVLPSVECECLIGDEPKGDDFALGCLVKSTHGWRVVNC
jgi:hypothetical protein